jgi:hypothetical protein
MTGEGLKNFNGYHITDTSKLTGDSKGNYLVAHQNAVK